MALNDPLFTINKSFSSYYKNHQDITYQFILSIALGLSAFLGFCVCRLAIVKLPTYRT